MSETIRVLKFNKKNFQKKIFENFSDRFNGALHRTLGAAA